MHKEYNKNMHKEYNLTNIKKFYMHKEYNLSTRLSKFTLNIEIYEEFVQFLSKLV